MVGGEALLRFLICLALAIAGIGYAGWYGLALGIAPICAVLISLRGQHGHGDGWPGRPLVRALGRARRLLIGSVLAMVLVNGGPIAMQLLARRRPAGARRPSSSPW